MTVKITGMQKLLQELDSKLGEAAMEQLSDRALKAATPAMEAAIRASLEPVKVTGATLDEMKLGPPKPIGYGRRRAYIYWEGPKSRYKLIHLNEWGTVKNPNPRAKGRIGVGMKVALPVYRKLIKKVLELGV